MASKQSIEQAAETMSNIEISDEQLDELAEQAYPFEYIPFETPEWNNNEKFEVANKRAIFIEGAEAILKLLKK